MRCEEIQMLTVLTSDPDARIRSFVRSYALRECSVAGLNSDEPVLARLGAVLEFQFAVPFDVHFIGTEFVMHSFPVTVIGALSYRRARIVIRNPVQVLSVFFEPLGFHALFGVPNAELTDIGAEAHSILGHDISALNERLGNTPNFAERVILLNEFFLGRVNRVRTSQSITESLRMLISRTAPITVSEAARQSGISTRTLERVALEYIGMTPKLVNRVARFERALRRKIEIGSSWTEAAYIGGYHDQMHMIRDFHALAGNTPTQVLKEIKSDHLSHLGLRRKTRRMAR
jgi:AraC-like DNA-binding protein